MAHVKVDNLTLEYPISLGPKRLLPGRISRAEKVRAIMRRTVGSPIVHDGRQPHVRALDDVSFELKRGDRLALLGHNGSGKSTLLMALAGILAPTAGTISLTGHVEALFNIRLGFRPEATGRRNIILRGLAHGLRREDIENLIDEIIEFSEIGEFIDLPLYTYSAGMAARLAFATVTSFTPQILLLDEWIGAGDSAFQRKAKARMERFVDKAGIVVLATHNSNLARRVCNKSITLEKGRIKSRKNALHSADGKADNPTKPAATVPAIPAPTD